VTVVLLLGRFDRDATVSELERFEGARLVYANVGPDLIGRIRLALDDSENPVEPLTKAPGRSTTSRRAAPRAPTKPLQPERWHLSAAVPAAAGSSPAPAIRSMAARWIALGHRHHCHRTRRGHRTRHGTAIDRATAIGTDTATDTLLGTPGGARCPVAHVAPARRVRARVSDLLRCRMWCCSGHRSARDAAQADGRDVVGGRCPFPHDSVRSALAPDLVLCAGCCACAATTHRQRLTVGSRTALLLSARMLISAIRCTLTYVVLRA
jgi:hypothetical protein